MFGKKDKSPQSEIWTVNADIVTGPGHAYYQRLDKALREAEFDSKVRQLCAPYYVQDETRGGRKGIDPYVYFKMLMVGFFENIGSERAIASRCADSLSIRFFLNYELTEQTPDHSSLSKIRTRLGTDVYEQAFGIILETLAKKRLLKGKQIGIDTSVIEANASMRTLVNNHTGETYDEYVKRLAAAAGVDEEDKSAIRKFDRKRKDKKMSNDDWHNPHDPDARIGPTKQKKIKMIHKTDHIVDLESGAIVKVQIIPGHQQDDQDMAEHLKQAEEALKRAKNNTLEESPIAVITADKGYFNIDELEKLQEKGIKTVIEDRSINRNLNKLGPEKKKVLQNARRSVKTKYGKRVKKRRGEFLERSFTHVLDNGDLRRSTLSGIQNLQKRNLIGGMCCNLSIFMRKTYGFGTPKQFIAAVSRLADTLLSLFTAWWRSIIVHSSIWNKNIYLTTGNIFKYN